mmetsp:Transcript_13559/g.20476  ORF Transcript_13559/g.20476 Transcript_13559/m.20476 type:complete len:95 (+) Transcript_13559:287-571(+)
MASDPSVNATFNNAYDALLSVHVFESSLLIYPVAMTKNKRDPNQLYVVTMYSDAEEAMLNPEYGASTQEERSLMALVQPDAIFGPLGLGTNTLN